MRKASFGQKALGYLHRVFLAFFYILLRATIGLWCRLHFRPRWNVPPEVKGLRPPFLVLGDHVHPMDMFIIGLALRPVIHWVAADANFRSPFMKFVMTVLAGAVAKAKNRSDMVTLSHLRLLTEVGSVIGVYQEGERSWDGVSLPPVSGTDKLVRFLKVPVVYAHLEGAYLEHPRWTWSGNRTDINVRYELLISREESSILPLSEITRRIEETARYDEWAYQAEARIPLRGEKRAENVELVCFRCPSCGSVNTLKSTGNDFGCRVCSLKGGIDELGSFTWQDDRGISWPGGEPFRNVRDWNLWQKEHYEAELDGVFSDSGDPGSHLFWEDRDVVRISRGKRGMQMKLLGIGSARFYGDRIELEASIDSAPRARGVNLVIPLDDINSFSVFKQFYTEFYFDKQLYQLSFTNRSVSGYKWLMLFNMILDRKVHHSGD